MLRKAEENLTHKNNQSTADPRESRGKAHTQNIQSSAGPKESRGKSHTKNNQSSAGAKESRGKSHTKHYHIAAGSIAFTVCRIMQLWIKVIAYAGNNAKLPSIIIIIALLQIGQPFHFSIWYIMMTLYPLLHLPFCS